MNNQYKNELLEIKKHIMTSNYNLCVSQINSLVTSLVSKNLIDNHKLKNIMTALEDNDFEYIVKLLAE